MLALKYSHQLSWGDLKFIEDPMHAIRTVESEHGRRNGGKSIENAHLHDLPNGDDRRFDPYRFLKIKLERGDVFLVNRSTLAPAVTSLDIDDDGKPEYTLRHSTSQYFHSAFRSALRHIPESKPVGVLRDEPKQVVETKKPEKIINTKEKHQIKIKYVTVNGAENPDTYEVKLTVLDTSTNRIYMRQAIDVLKHDTSKVFSIEKGEKFKIYPVREHMMDVREDFAQNKNFAQSEANKRIKPLDIEPSEELQGGVTLHTVTIHVPPILRMGCFFDGTGNDTSDPKKYSNVYQLFDLYETRIKKLPESFKAVYIRGVGTEGDEFFEKIMGSAAGIGAIERIAGMIYELERGCVRYKDKFEAYPEEILLDVFGFSRGATTARHFMNVIKQGFYGFADGKMQQYISPDIIKFSFVGLFDSVGSYGIAGDNEDNGYNFNIKKQWIADKGRVIHFNALNEYRKNFDLQSIFSHQKRACPENIQQGQYYEIGLIGAHSDVGGSYGDNEQGVQNTHINPTQLSVMALKKMYEFAVGCGVPMKALSLNNIENELVEKYRFIENKLLDLSIRKIWMKWVAHKKYQQVLEIRIEKYKRWDKDKNESFIRLFERKLVTVNKDINHLSIQLQVVLSSEYDQFIQCWEYLDKYYVHESHGPINGGIGMGVEVDKLFSPSHLMRDVFFKPAVDFEQENKKADRIVYRDGRRRKIDIDEFDFVTAKEFK